VDPSKRFNPTDDQIQFEKLEPYCDLLIKVMESDFGEDSFLDDLLNGLIFDAIVVDLGLLAHFQVQTRFLKLVENNLK
jgi:hypothetical protein